VVGSGIFVLPATVALILVPASPVAYLMAAFLTGRTPHVSIAVFAAATCALGPNAAFR
jgi:amino acid transporter